MEHSSSCLKLYLADMIPPIASSDRGLIYSGESFLSNSDN